MADHPIQNLMDTTMEKIRQMVDSNTIIGNPMNLADGTTVIPVSKATFGFASGGSDLPSKNPKDLFGGGSGAGVTISPVAFLVVQKDGTVRLMQLTDTSNNIDRALSLLPEMMDKVTTLLKKEEKEQPKQSEEKQE